MRRGNGRGRIVGVRCAADLLRQVNRVAAATQLSRAAVVQEAISLYCEYWEKEGAAIQMAECRGMLEAAQQVLQEMKRKQ